MIKLKQILTEGKGDCYQAAGKLIMDFLGDKKATLVHGMVDGQGALDGLRFGHAWVEYGNKILDHSNGKKQEMPKTLYYRVGNVKSSECKYYDPGKAAGWMIKKKHWGPWEISGATIKLQTEDIPDVKGEIGKKKTKIQNIDLDKIFMKGRKKKRTTDEAITLPIEIGDTVLMGKFKNKKVVVKTISWNEKGDLLINGKSSMRMRLVKKVEPSDEQ